MRSRPGLAALLLASTARAALAATAGAAQVATAGTALMATVGTALVATAGAALAAELPVRGVTLSSAGLAQVERAGPVPPEEGAVTFRVPVEDVDDILRSLVVADPAGRVEGVRLPAQDLAAEAFRGLPVRPADFESRASLLNALRGQAVAVGGMEGRIAEAAETTEALRISVVTDTGLRSVTLREGDQVRLLDAALAARLARAAEALAQTRSADTREIAVALRPGAPGAREVALTYVAAAPLWKPSWRLAVPGFDETAGMARLMGWAVVENRSGSDWADVRLSLVSGAAAAFRQRLYSPVLLPRPELPIEGSGQVQVRPDTGGVPMPPPPPRPATMAMPAPSMAPSAPGAAMAGRGAADRMAMGEIAAPTAEASATASLGRVAFTLADPVTIRAGETANVPFLDVRLAAERVWWVQGLGGRHPLQAVRLRNETPHALPGGLATVYGSGGAEAGGFLGDAQILGMAPGEARLLGFARDQDVRYSTAERGESTPTGVEIRRGAVQVTLRGLHTVSLAVDSRGTRGRVVVDLPARRGETPRFTPTAEGDFGLRVEAMLEGTPTTLDWVWERAQSQVIALWDPALGDPLPIQWRDLTLERDVARLPGGGDRFEQLRALLARLPAEATGRADLAALVEDFAKARQLLDAFRESARAHAAADAALNRARRAFEDRTGPEREQARIALNTASRNAETAGSAADAAWTAWRTAAQRVTSRAGR